MPEYFRYVTDRGEIQFGWGFPFVFDKPEGMNEADTNRQETGGYDEDGTEYEYPTYSPRLVTLPGSFRSSNKAGLYSMRADMVRIMNGKDKGRLYYYNGYKEYFSEAVADIPQFGQRMQNVMMFTCYFNLYRFYWKEAKPTKNNLFYRENHIKGTFQFPFVFTTRYSKGNLINLGDVEADWKITITATSNQTLQTLFLNTGLEIKNNTTGETMLLEYDMTDGEVITIDTENAKVTSSINGNILYALSGSSTFFKLKQGKNEIEATNYNTSIPVYINSEFYNRYLGV